MGYRIGEVADFLSLTKEGIRYYEKKGIITSVRDENNDYRYYPRFEITKLKHIRALQSIGYSLDEACALSIRIDWNNSDAFDEKLRELDQKEADLKRVRRQLEEQKRVIRQYKSGQIELRERPDYLFLPRVPAEDSAQSQRDKAFISHLRRVEKVWTASIPLVTLYAKHFDEDLNPVIDVMGSAVDAQNARELDLPTEGTICIPGGRFICYVVAGIYEEGLSIEPVLDFIRENHLTISGSTYGALRLMNRLPNGKMEGLFELFFPVQ